jgi:hypothetical protein
MVAVVALVAAACSSGPSGQVGDTLAAMDGTVTLVKVVSPAVPVGASAQPGPGHKLVAVVLTVHSPAAASSRFGAIYIDTKLVDSTNQAHTGKGTVKYAVTSCAGYAAFATLGPGQSQTGCEIFQLAATATPMQLKIAGKVSANWTISASAIQTAAGAGVGSAQTPTAPQPQALGASPTITDTTPTTTAVTPTTDTTPTTAVTPTTTATSAGGGGATATPAAPNPAKAHQARAAGASKAPRIWRVVPHGGFVGTKAQIYGKRMTGVTAVTFNGVPATIVQALPGKIVVLVPAGATTGPVVVYLTSGTLTSPRTYVVL